jgi:hypothetical protein
MTWYSLTDQIDWDVALREENNRVNPLGLADLDRKMRKVGLAYQHLISQWNMLPMLPKGPLSLYCTWPVAPTNGHSKGKASREAHPKPPSMQPQTNDPISRVRVKAIRQK